MPVENIVAESVLGVRWDFKKDIIMCDIRNQSTHSLRQHNKTNFKATNPSHCKWNLWPVGLNIPIYGKNKYTYGKNYGLIKQLTGATQFPKSCRKRGKFPQINAYAQVCLIFPGQ